MLSGAVGILLPAVVGLLAGGGAGALVAVLLRPGAGGPPRQR
ncbi:hypothetical protein [Saccharopolyspora cebuensis]|uniref:Uncharacterized protein n=1 Tax=Saccharopolyspora cebuensis TaxID=418759 RepID=A0ABV4CNI6_9PSEU